MWRPWNENNVENNMDCDVENLACELEDSANDIRSRVHLPFEAKQIVLNVFNGLKLSEASEADAMKKTSFLTQVSFATVWRIVKFGVQKRSIRRDAGKIKKIEEWQTETIRRKVYDMYKRNVVPVVETLRSELIEDNTGINCSPTTLWRFLKQIGFRFKKIDRRQVIMESSRIVELRYNYLKQIKKYREENKFICYLDETWYDTHDVVSKGWVDNSKQCALDTPSSRGQRIIILHAGSANGWSGELLLSAKKVKSASLDYHEDMTSELFEEWFKEKLLPFLPANSVIVMDNASYHSRQLRKIPNSSSNKNEIAEFLQKEDLYYEDHYTKKQLLAVLSTKQFNKQYCVDSIAAELGHTVLRLPPYYCIFNPIELIWAQVKQGIRRRNTAPKFSECTINVIKNEINNISSQNWTEAINHVIKIENDYIDVSNLHYEFIINVDDCSSSEEEI